ALSLRGAGSSGHRLFTVRHGLLRLLELPARRAEAGRGDDRALRDELPADCADVAPPRLAQPAREGAWRCGRSGGTASADALARTLAGRHFLWPAAVRQLGPAQGQSGAERRRVARRARAG